MVSTEGGLGSQAVMIGLWVLTVLELLGMGVAGLSKFQGDGWVRMFEGCLDRRSWSANGNTRPFGSLPACSASSKWFNTVHDEACLADWC